MPLSSGAATFTTCPDCAGTRLNEAARSSTIDGLSIADACALQVSDLAAWLASVRDPSVAPLVSKLSGLLDAFVDSDSAISASIAPPAHCRAARLSAPKLVRTWGRP